VNSIWTKTLGSFAIAGPLALVIGYTILMARSGQGPDSGWFVSHAFLLLGVGLLLPTSIGIRVYLHKSTGIAADIGMTLAFIGGLTLVGQFAIDLAVGQLAVDQSQMRELFKTLSSSSIIALPFQSVGPIAFYSSLLVLTSLLWKNRVIAWWAGLLACLGIMSVGAGAITGIALITLLGFLAMCIGFLPIGSKLFTLSNA
jgi:hypothetical protein